MTFFSHLPGFSDFPFHFPDFPYLLLCSMSCMTLSSKEQPLFQTRIPFMTPSFTLFVLLRVSDNTTSQNIGGTDAWAVPTSNLGGPSPSPLQVSAPVDSRTFKLKNVELIIVCARK